MTRRSKISNQEFKELVYPLILRNATYKEIADAVSEHIGKSFSVSAVQYKLLRCGFPGKEHRFSTRNTAEIL